MYKSGRLKQIIDFNTFFGKYGAHKSGKVLKVSGNTMYTEYYLMSWALGPCNIRVNYAYKSGTLKRTSNAYYYSSIYSYGKKTKTFYANKAITAYTSVSVSKRAFTMSKNKAVQIVSCYCNGNKMLIKVKYNGKYGWIKAQTEYKGEDGKTFSNTTYAG